MKLSKTHPNLYKAYLSNGLINILIGLFGLMQTTQTFVSYAFIAIYIILGLVIVFFTIRYSTQAIRIALVSGLFYNSFFVILFLLSLGLAFDEGRETAYVIPLFLGHTLATYIIAIEPPRNPITQKSEPL